MLPNVKTQENLKHKITIVIRYTWCEKAGCFFGLEKGGFTYIVTAMSLPYLFFELSLLNLY